VSIMVANHFVCVMKVKVLIRSTEVRSAAFRRSGALSSDPDFFEGFDYEFVCWDPKDGELCVIRMKSDESQMEVRKVTDVQIVPENCVKGRKTNRTI